MKQLILFLTILPILVNAQLRQPCAPSFIEISPTFDEACINCGFNGYVGSTAGWDVQPVPADFCGVNPAPRWLGFIAPAQNATYTITPMNCAGGKGMQAALYHDTDEPALVCGAGCDTCGDVPLVLNATNLTIGVNYFFLLTGYDEDVCDFIISVFPPGGMLPPITTSAITGPVTVCPGSTTSFSINPSVGAGYYLWESNNTGVKFNGLNSPAILEGPAAAAVQVTFPPGASSGTQIAICVTPANSCNTGTQRCKTVTVQNIPVTNLPKVVICNEDAPYILPWGTAVYESEIYEHTYSTATGCDSIVRQQVQVSWPIQKILTRYVCEGTTVDVCGQEFSQSGEYQVICTAANGCDSTITLKLNVLDPVAEIIGGDTLSACGAASLKLYSHYSPQPQFPGFSLKTWKNLDSGSTSMGEQYSVTQSGTYTLTTTSQGSGASCVARDTVHVEFHPEQPPLNAFAGASNSITCIDSVSVLSGGANSTATSFMWLGPDGFSADTSTVVVDSTGYYFFTAANDQCNEIVPVLLYWNKYAGYMNIGSTVIGCNKPSTITAMPNPLTLLLQWTIPENDTLQGSQITGHVPGLYTVSAYNPANGCSFTDSITVVADTVVPVAAVVVNNAVNGQNNGSAFVLMESGTPPYYYSWTQNGTVIGNSSIMLNLQPGVYHLYIKSSNNCDTTITFEVKDILVGTNEPTADHRWNIAPNPAAHTIAVQFAGEDLPPATIVRCFDMTGREVYRSNMPAGQGVLSMDCSSFAPGIYTVEIVPLDHSPVTRLRVAVVR